MTQIQDITAVEEPKANKFSVVLDKVFFLSNEHLMILMHHMLETAEEKLREQAEKVEDAVEKRKYTSCTRIVGNEKGGVGNLFFLNFNQSLTIVRASETSSLTEESEDLVEHDEMEEMVAITTMYAKAMSLYGDEVNQLEARLEYLEIMNSDIFDKDALNPKSICEVFQKTIENIDMAIEAKLIFYRLFDVEVCAKLGVMYKALNEVFIENDILPEIVLKPTAWQDPPEIEEDVVTTVATYYDPNEKVSTDFIPRTKEDMSRIINDFMSGDMVISGDEIELPESFFRSPAQQIKDGKQCYERKEVIKALSRLQYKLTSLHHGVDDLSAEKIKQEMLADIAGKSDTTEKEVNVMDERSIDFVGLMFEAINKDDSISEVMTQLIIRLQVPLMKLAMLDEDLFENEYHPVRVAIDFLTKAGATIKQKADYPYAELEPIVDEILDNFDVDLEVFDNAIYKLQDILNNIEQLAKERERKQQQKIIHEHAKKVVIGQLKAAASGKKIHDAIKPLILKTWPSYMLRQYVRFGKGSTQWVFSVMLLRLLLKSIQPPRNHTQFEELKINHQALVETVGDELSVNLTNKDELSKQLKLLGKYFNAVIDKSSARFSEKEQVVEQHQESSEQMENSSDVVMKEIMQQAAIAEKKIALLPETAKPGAWYEIYMGETKAVRRLKLSVVLMNTAQLVFVNVSGKKVIEKSADEFAAELQDNRSHMISEHSTFDRALGKVVDTIAS